MKKIKAFIILLVLGIVSTESSFAVVSSDILKGLIGNSETVTIPRDEYEKLLKYQKLDLLNEYVDYLYYGEVDHDAMLESAAMGLIAGIGDVYSSYYTKEEFEKFNEESEGVYAGIGCQLLADPDDEMITVTRVFKGSPADEAGILSGDKIVYVDETYYSAYDMDEAVRVMRGTPGETVKITVLRKLKRLDFDIVRQQVTINYVEHEILPQNIGYVIVYDFMGNAAEGFKEAIDEFRSRQVSGVIIDLRNNGGGLVDIAVDMADQILPEGTVVSMKDKWGRETKETIDDNYYNVPIAVLVNGYTASSSEILTGAIRDNQAGVIVGKKTFGKGIVQSVFPFEDGSGIKLTTAWYFTPNGENIHEKGIEPDIEVDLDEEVITRYGINNLPHDQDAQLQKAIEVLISEGNK